MTVRSRCLALLEATVSGNVVHALYLCPPGRTAVVKDVVFQHFSTAPRRVELYVRRGNSFASLLQGLALDPVQPLRSAERFVVLHPGDQLVFNQSGTETALVRVAAWGALLDGEPS